MQASCCLSVVLCVSDLFILQLKGDHPLKLASSFGVSSRSQSHRPLPRYLNRSKFFLLIIRIAILLFASLQVANFLNFLNFFANFSQSPQHHISCLNVLENIQVWECSKVSSNSFCLIG